MLAFEPRWPRVRRIQGRGRLVRRFALPLDVCLTSNVRMSKGVAGAGWKLGAMKKRCFELMWEQNSHKVEPYPLGGRPHVVCVRYSSAETDRTSDWSKCPVDRLCVGSMGLGLIVDDAPKYIDLDWYCDYAPPGNGMVVVSVFTGESGI